MGNSESQPQDFTTGVSQKFAGSVLDYEAIGSGNMLMVSANGTAVKLEPKSGG
jgi:hypothetical protein